MTNPPKKAPRANINDLLATMTALRTPVTGCPWDLEQDFASIAPYTIEEAYEVAAAIEARDWNGLKEELGDLLLQTVFHAQMANERGLFDFADVVATLDAKLVSRHPHVFGDAVAADSGAVLANWEAIKASERAAKKKPGVLDDVPAALPALMRSEKLQKRAARVGFDWDSAPRVVEKLTEEANEIVAAREAGEPQARIDEEVGDLLFVVVNLARHLGTDPEAALRSANAKFMRRFNYIEAELEKSGVTPKDASLEEMEALWQAAKAAEKA